MCECFGPAHFYDLPVRTYPAERWLIVDDSRQITFGVPCVFNLIRQVIDNAGADNSGLHNQYNGSLAYGSTQLSYHTYNVYVAGDPSITKVFYYMSDTVVSAG